MAYLLNDYMLLRLLIIASILTLSGMAAAADHASAAKLRDLSLEELMEIPVYSASKFDQKLSETPAAMTVITADEISKYGYRTLGDILRSVRGFFVTYDRNYQYLGVRGFGRPGDYNSRVAFLIDGHRLNANIYGDVGIDTSFPLDVDLIERVEIMRGPGHSLYGNNAFFGVVNIITRKADDLHGAETSVEGGNQETYKTRMTYGSTYKNGFELLLSGSTYASEGDDHLYYQEFDNPLTNNGIAEDLDEDEFSSLFGKLSWRDFTIESAFIDRSKEIPTAAYGVVFNHPAAQATDKRAFVDLTYEHRLVSGCDLLLRTFYDYVSYAGDYPLDWSEDPQIPYIVINDDSSHGRWWGSEFQLVKTVFEKHRLTAGGEVRDNVQQDQANRDQEVYLDDKRDLTEWGIFFQDEFRMTSTIILNAGIRYDHFETFGSTTNPRIAVIYSPWATTVFKLVYGEAFRAPSAYELYYHDGGYSAKPSKELHPEESAAYEAFWEQYIGEHLFLTLGAFHLHIDDLISLTTDPADGLLMFRNMEDLETTGLEVELSGKWKRGLEGRISYTYQHVEDDQGRGISNSPNHQAKANVSIPLLSRNFFLSVEEQYMSKRKTISRDEVDDYFLTNVTLLGRNLRKGLDISATVYNLFDNAYEDPGSEEHLQDALDQDGLSVRLKLTYRF